jgi:thymidylate synthase (FAD)
MTAVRLVAKTIPVNLDDVNTIEEFVAYAARVSNPANQANSETAPKLLKYLMDNRHWSPFEMVSIVMEIVTTRDIAHQILRHRSFSFQEFSQRYANAKTMGFVTREARMQDAKNRQASIDTDDSEIKGLWEEWQLMVMQTARDAYDWAIQKGIAKEQARVVLPEGLTVSKLYMAGSLRSWIHYCQLRCESGTQKEHREVANQARDILSEEFPSIAVLLKEQSGN